MVVMWKFSAPCGNASLRRMRRQTDFKVEIPGSSARGDATSVVLQKISNQ